MDVASRYQPRVRPAQGGRIADDMSNDSEGPEASPRRKFQRTIPESKDTNDTTFRKPSMPASAMRPQLDQRNNFTQRRLRENVRVPSGPRDFPSPGRRLGSNSTQTTPSATEPANPTSRAFLPHTVSEPFFGRNTDANRFSFGNGIPSSNGEADSPTTPSDRLRDHFSLLPTVNFDDFQNSLAGYDTTNSILDAFPTASGGRAGSKDVGSSMARNDWLGGTRVAAQKSEPKLDTGVRRSESLRRRLSAAPDAPKQPGAQSSGPRPGQPSNMSIRTRRQSSVPQNNYPGPPPPPVGAGSRAPRKSVGPGLITSMMDHRKSTQPIPSSSSESSLKPSLARTASLGKVSNRRSTVQPPMPIFGDGSRTSAITATTQSRQNKTKSLLPPPRDPELDAPSAQPAPKNRAHTPSSSGNKRQSTISGRASGLGARTISPTDARRLKRLSMMQAPPVPTSLSRGPPSPQEELPAMKLEMPRLAQPSPSLIPRKTNSATPTSLRAPSPDGRAGTGGGMSLGSRASVQSLATTSSSQSRLPTAKPRSVHSSSAQYGDDDEIVPPVPAIPKAYESPREYEVPFFSGRRKSTQSAGSSHEPTMNDFDPDGLFMQDLPPMPPPRSATETFSEARRKPSGEYSLPLRRMETADPAESSSNGVGPKALRLQHPDATGRKNNNLQPLRLPPMNLMPINTPTSNKIAGLPRPTQELEDRDGYDYARTPEPKRTAKTPSTPMTASKATFFRRQEGEQAMQNDVRSATAHFGLRDALQMDDTATRFFDDSDTEGQSAGLPIAKAKHRSAITPFASGSLPKGSGEYARRMANASGEFDDDYSLGNYENLQLQSSKPLGSKLRRSGTDTTTKASDAFTLDSPILDPAPAESKKESNGGGLRRKLSLGWRRTSSKGANLAESKSSPPQDPSAADKERSKAQTRSNEMPPPRLPASATWSGDISSLPSSVRPSLESRRQSAAVSINTFSNVSISNESDSSGPVPAPKTNALRSEQPQPVTAANRSSSWGNVGGNGNPRPTSMKLPSSMPKTRQATGTPSISAIIKDKDDLAADDEMRRLSQKRRDVDSAARETEDLKRRAQARSPMSPERVLHDRNCALNIFERGEVMDYGGDGVYFTGTKTARKIIGSLTALVAPPVAAGEDKGGKAGNYGYDDERGDYNIVLGDHLAYRYEVVDLLGKGSFGQVVRCVDHKEGGVVAVKIIRNKKRFHQQALVEVGILGRLREWDPDGTHATLSITSSFYFRSHLCIVTPCLSINLYELIRAHNFAGFSLPLIRRFARQLLASLVLLQQKRIIHCDLKPENILLCEARKADVRVIDFGSSCKEEEKVYTYIQSRFYRSPEVILGSSYGLGIDMWSLGCILAELWTGYPLFPGENEQEQLACIMEVFGPPDRHVVERCSRKKLFFDSLGKPRVTVSSKGRRRRPSSKTLAQSLKTDDEAFLDFLARCLRWDPERRMKPHEAVGHPFVTNAAMGARAGIPDEARRAARARGAAPGANGTNGGPSPTKRALPGTTTGNAFAQQRALLQHTPAKTRQPPQQLLPDTPQTALRAANAGQRAQGSPSKASHQAAGRRHSTLPASAAAGGVKRGSGGAVMGQQQQRLGSVGAGPAGGVAGGGSLATLAARESMGSAHGVGGARWRG